MSKGINPDYLDNGVRPEDDFYLFVNGGWLKNTEIPPDRNSWGSFHELAKTVWRTKIRPEALRHQIKTDPHPPGLYRAVAAPSNINSFYNAFNISPQSPWFRKHEDRIKIW